MGMWVNQYTAASEGPLGGLLDICCADTEDSTLKSAACALDMLAHARMIGIEMGEQQNAEVRGSRMSQQQSWT